MIKIGKVDPDIATLALRYEQRLMQFVRVKKKVIKSSSGIDKFVAQKNSSNFMIVLDESGEQLTSVEFASFFEEKQSQGVYKTLSFFVGDPYGFNKETLHSADRQLGLMKGTLPSDLAWLIAWEQVYRAFTIIHQTPYHHQ